MAESARSGTFSNTNPEKVDKEKGGDPKFWELFEVTRLKGHQSINRSTNGNVTTIGLHIRSRAKNIATGKYRPKLGPRAYLKYTPIVSIQKRVLKRSLRSAIHTTDSMCSG
jgi:hypothetical protein